MEKYLIKNGRLIDPLEKLDAVNDILIVGDKIEKIGPGIDDPEAKVVDASGKIISPGFVDMHAHLREPGREDKETIYTGTRSAVQGGFTAIACMPNTEPAIDRADTVNLVKAIAVKDGICDVFVIGAITENREGNKISDLKSLKKAGVVGVSDDGASVEDPEIMLNALKEARKEGILVIAHCEDPGLSLKGVMNKGLVSTKMGLRGMPKESEYARVKRDVELAAKAGAAIHIAHISCMESVDIVRQAKAKGIRVTAETCPHYFAMTEDCCVTYDTNTKMNPPLRTSEDLKAIKEGLKDGTIDAIATDHAPHTDCEKDVEFDYAPFGIIGLETALGIAVIELIDKKVLTWPELISKLSSNPSRILGLKGPTLLKGAKADVAIIDPSVEYTYTRDNIRSKSKNSPFIGWQLKGRAEKVFVSGKIVLGGAAPA
ncbi:MAG: dihydroorotase [Candidatus Omnitrophica bacterium]|nr:dihydroorotase [Candidatus Omnitrophota bacterium]